MREINITEVDIVATEIVNLHSSHLVNPRGY